MEGKKPNYEMIGKLMWHKGISAALEFIAKDSENQIDDVIIPVVNKIAVEIFPLDKE